MDTPFFSLVGFGWSVGRLGRIGISRGFVYLLSAGGWSVGGQAVRRLKERAFHDDYDDFCFLLFPYPRYEHLFFSPFLLSPRGF